MNTRPSTEDQYFPASTFPSLYCQIPFPEPRSHSLFPVLQNRIPRRTGIGELQPVGSGQR